MPPLLFYFSSTSRLPAAPPLSTPVELAPHLLRHATSLPPHRPTCQLQQVVVHHAPADASVVGVDFKAATALSSSTQPSGSRRPPASRRWLRQPLRRSMKAKLYRFDKEGNQWKERGVGTVKLLKHKETGKVRLVMRQNKTLKICANHLVLPTMTTQEHAGNEESCVWHAADFSVGELKDETFAIRFASVENCKAFREKIEEIAEFQGKKDTEDGSAAAELIEKLSFESKD